MKIQILMVIFGWIALLDSCLWMLVDCRMTRFEHQLKHQLFGSLMLCFSIPYRFCDNLTCITQSIVCHFQRFGYQRPGQKGTSLKLIEYLAKWMLSKRHISPNGNANIVRITMSCWHMKKTNVIILDTIVLGGTYVII